jgi:uroporphyrinogen decarboxylase
MMAAIITRQRTDPMNSREIVLRTLEYRHPDRVAASFPAPYWNDFTNVSYAYEGYDPTWREVRPGWQEYVDEWGNTWARVDATSKGEVVRGVLADWAALETLRLPDLANPANYVRVREVCSDPANGRFRLGGLPGFPFNIARYMRHLEEFLADLLLEPNNVRLLLGRVEELLADMIVQYARAGVDGVMFCEDWGTQNSLMIHPRTWREVFKPGFVRLCGVAHAHNLKVFMHSCGRITDIIPDLIAAGIDLLQFDQPRLHGIDALARFHGQITFWCPVDIQKTLQTHDEAAIAAEAVEMLTRLGGHGGFVAGYYGDNASIGLDPHWQDVACRAFTQHGVYRSP